MAGRKKVGLKDLGVVDPKADIRDSLDHPHDAESALRRGERAQVAIDVALNSRHMERMEAAINAALVPANLEKVQAATVLSSQHMERMQAAINAALVPANLEKAQAAINTVLSSQHMEQMQAAINAALVPASLEKAQAAINTVLSSQHMERMQAAINAALATANLEQAQAAINTVLSPQRMERMEAGLYAAVSNYQNLVARSALASFLVSPEQSGKPPAQTVEVEGFDSLQVADVYEADIVSPNSVDLQIIKAIAEGEVAELPPSATQRLQSVCLQIVVYWDMLLRIFNTCMAIMYLTALMSSATVPADIPKQAKQLSNHQRQLLADYRIVNREGARLRAGPSTQSAIIASLSFAHPVEVIEYNDKGWYRVEAETPDGFLEGWMYVSVTTPLPKPKYPRGQEVDAETF